jgi:geranylgeranyl reductase family protein
MPIGTMQDTNPIYDLIIVGGGPSGAASALYAKRAGLKALLLDRATFPRDKICGDALSGKSIGLLNDLQLLDRVKELPGAPISKVVFGSPEHIDAVIDLTRHPLKDFVTGEWVPMEGYVVRRQYLDELLFGEAAKAAADTLQGFRVLDLVWDGDQVCGVRGQMDGEEEEREYRGKLVLGCDGYNSIVARKTGLYEHDPDHWVVALRCYYEGVTGLEGQIELHFVDEVVPGYFWAFPLENGYANVGIGMLHSRLKSRNVDLKSALQQVISRPPFAERFKNARPTEEPVGWNLPVGSKRRKVHGNGFLLLGDAASLIDPFTGEGIGNALYSARLAVETAEAAIRADDTSEAFLKRYDDQLWGTLGNEFKTSKRLQNLGRWRPLLNFVIRKAARNKEISDLMCGMMAQAVPMKHLASPMFYLKLLFLR